MPDIRIKITNAYNNKGEIHSKEIKINGNVVISNYIDETKKPYGFMNATVKGNKVSIHQRNSHTGTLDFSKEKYDIFLKILKMDGNGDEFALSDLIKTTKESLGLDNSFTVRKDMNAGILNILKGNEIYLHLDFETGAEKAQQATKTQETQKANNTATQKTKESETPQSSSIKDKLEFLKQYIPNTNVKPIAIDLKVQDSKNPFNSNYVDRTVHGQYTVEEDKTSVWAIKDKFKVGFDRIKYANPDLNITNNTFFSKGTVINIPDGFPLKYEKINNLDDVIKATQLDENYIRNTLAKIEKLKLEAYQDKENGGVLTIGFGHTGKVNGKALSENTKITEVQAYKLLAEDLVAQTATVRSYFGDNDFDKAPKSVQMGLIDMAFNGGMYPIRINNQKDYISKGDYVGAVEHMFYEGTDPVFKKGLRKRSFCRVMMAVKDLSPEDRKKVLDDIETKCKAIIEEHTGKDNTDLQQLWDNAQKGIF